MSPNPREHILEIGVRFDLVGLCAFNQAERYAPTSTILSPENLKFFQPRVTPRKSRSIAFVSIAASPSSTYLTRAPRVPEPLVVPDGAQSQYVAQRGQNQCRFQFGWETAGLSGRCADPNSILRQSPNCKIAARAMSCPGRPAYASSVTPFIWMFSRALIADKSHVNRERINSEALRAVEQALE